METSICCIFIKKLMLKLKKNNKLKYLILIFTIFCQNLAIFCYAESTGPQFFLYEGQLLKTDQTPFKGSFNFRFSLWNSSNATSSDISSGHINTNAMSYLGWQESQAYTLLKNGRFSVKIGKIISIPDKILKTNSNLFLQVEIKKTGESDSSYELLDSNYYDENIDRLILSVVPFAKNSDKLDFRDTGYGAGEIPFLDNQGKIPRQLLPDDLQHPEKSVIDNNTGKIRENLLPNQQNQNIQVIGGEGNTFTLDLKGQASSTDSIMLKFGKILGKYLKWDGLLNKFVFSDDLKITGDLETSGHANIFGSLSLGSNLSMGGNLRVGGNSNFQGNVDITGELKVNGQVISTESGGGSVVAIYNKQDVLNPSYPNSIFNADGSANTGEMYEENENGKNINRWTSTRSTIQDYDIIIRYKIPEKFIEFRDSNTIDFECFTDGKDTNKAFVDIKVEKEGVEDTDQISGNGYHMQTDSQWTTKTFSLADRDIWHSRDVMIITIKMGSKDSKNIKVGDLTIKYKSK